MKSKAKEGDKRIGNKFWLQRSKHGRDKIFKTPEIMLEAAYDYFDFQSEQKWEKTDFRGKESKEVKIPVSSPFTLTGLCIYLGVNTVYFTQFEGTLKDKTDETSKEFSKVITHIREVIFTQKYEGAAVGAYNANIISRDLGLIDRQELLHEIGTIAGYKILDGDSLIKKG